MATKYLISTLAGYAAGIAAMVVLFPSPSPCRRREHQAAQQVQHGHLSGYDEEGYAAAKARRQELDAIEAAFPQESDAWPGSTATLRLWMRPAGTTVRIYRVGPEPQLTVGDKTMEGVPMTAPLGHRQHARIRVASDRPMPYFARLSAPGRVGFAPFAAARDGSASIRSRSSSPPAPGRRNFRDDDRDGDGDTWYATWGQLQARLGRPFPNRGVPPLLPDVRPALRAGLITQAGGRRALAEELDGASGARTGARL